MTEPHDDLVFSFVDGMEHVQKLAHENSKQHGFWEERDYTDYGMATKLALIHSEVSEALEALRIGESDEFEEELADIVIRTMDLAEGKRIALGKVIWEKMGRNAKRPPKHGKRF